MLDTLLAKQVSMLNLLPLLLFDVPLLHLVDTASHLLQEPGIIALVIHFLQPASLLCSLRLCLLILTILLTLELVLAFSMPVEQSVELPDVAKSSS